MLISIVQDIRTIEIEYKMPYIKNMRPLTHPKIEDVTAEGILHALSDPVRARIYASIASAECPQTCSTFLQVEGKTLPKSSLSQHFKVLREAGLVHSEKIGVEMKNVTRCAELKQRFGDLIPEIMKAYGLLKR